MSEGRIGVVVVAMALSLVVEAAWGEAELVKAVNLNGPPVAIDGRQWLGGTAVEDAGMSRFEDPSVALKPAADGLRALMIRSSVWHPGGENNVALIGLPEGEVTVFLYVWEDNDAQVYDVLLDGKEVAAEVRSGEAGEWKRLGPWVAATRDGKLTLTSRGGHANWSGIEVWRGALDRHPGEVPPEPPKPLTENARWFDETVAPVLARHCVECHNQNEKKGKLDLVTGAGLEHVVRPGKPQYSELWSVVKEEEMPKDRPPLEDGEKEILREWIERGAEWGSQPVDPFLSTTERRAGYDWWSLQPVRAVAPPAVADDQWPRNEVDRFILARLEKEGWTPAPEAPKEVLIRRLFFDLTGLPPEPEDVDRFAADRDPRAYEKLVDHLLARPQFGERWARRWLDVVRFGESQGFERNHVRDHAWRYRDWVVDAYNRDLPYDEFVRQQIAGDVLYPESLGALFATGYHVCGTWDMVGLSLGSGAMQRVAREEHLEDLVATCGQAFLALTVNCARCHDHKFDPIAQREYYQFAALLAGVGQDAKERSGIALKAEAKHGEFNGTAHVIIPRQPPVTYLLERGMVTKPKEAVAPAGLRALRGLDADLGLASDAPEGERRRELAAWLTDAANPLTARVYVNRLWHAVFGTGLVDTPSDFGFNGGAPSHPELLDWLAGRFVQDGWRSKALIRLLVTSAAYRQDSRHANEAAASRDADARLRWRAAMRRLEGEEVRDAMLAASGALNPRVGGPSYRDVKVADGRNGNHEFGDPTHSFDENSRRRTIYRLWARTGTHPLLESFDCADPSVMAPRRNRTTTPLQALSLLNNPFAENCSKHLAERVGRGEPAEQVRKAYRLVFGRAPAGEELELATGFVAAEGLAQFCLVLFNANEFLHLR